MRHYASVVIAACLAKSFFLFYFPAWAAFRMRTIVVAVFLSLAPGLAPSAHAQDLKSSLEPAIEAIASKVITWRRDIHQHPELSNREFRTAKLVAEHLESLGLEVQKEVAHTGVVGILQGGKPGGVVALRADMDALPVTEMLDVPFASTVRTTYNGQDVGVMHACGHDAHTAILMGTAEVLAGRKDDIPGTIKFIFQPAEEGPPEGEEGGAKLMLKEGVLGEPHAPQAIFGLHVWPALAGNLYYRAEGALAAADRFVITVHGRQTHGSQPWGGVDPIIVAAQIMTAIQIIPSRQLDITKAPTVISIGRINAGIRWNIIPDEVEMIGTIRTLDSQMREDVIRRIRQTAQQIAAAAGATATLSVQNVAPVTYNDPALTYQMLPTLRWAAGEQRVEETRPRMGAEDFAFFQEKIPGFYFLLGVNKEGVQAGEAAANHSPHFYVNEDVLIVGVRAMTGVALDYLSSQME